MYKHTFSKDLQDAVDKAVAQAEAEEAEQAAANPPEPEETKPAGYYATCSRDEYEARLRELHVHPGSNALPSN